MKHILGSCVLAGLFLFCACDDTLDTKVTWQIGDSDTWRVPELAQGVLYKAYNGIANRPDCFEDNFLDCATDNAVTNLRSSSVYKLKYKRDSACKSTCHRVVCHTGIQQFRI